MIGNTCEKNCLNTLNVSKELNEQKSIDVKSIHLLSENEWMKTTITAKGKRIKSIASELNCCCSNEENAA